MCMVYGVGEHAMCTCGIQRMSLQSCLSVPHEGPEDQTQVTRLCSKLCYLLSALHFKMS